MDNHERGAPSVFEVANPYHRPDKPSLPVTGRQSPSEKCAICISEINDRALAGKCLHAFCFLCLYEWCKVKPECPVCRQKFTHIITNVKSIDKYDEVPVPASPNVSIPAAAHSTVGSSSSSFDYTNHNLNSQMLHFHFLNAFNQPRLASRITPISTVALPLQMFSNENSTDRESYRPAMSVRFNDFGQFIDDLNTRQHRSWPSEPVVRLEPILAEPDPSYIPPVGSAAHRRYVYENELYVLPYGNGDSACFRRCSPTLYNANPSWTHRLMHFLKNELLVVVDNPCERLLLTSMILSAVRRHDILSKQFKLIVEPYVGPRTEHFIHEFYNFARSRYELDNYNRIAVYVPKSEATISKTATSETVYVIDDSDSEEAVDSAAVEPGLVGLSRVSSGRRRTSKLTSQGNASSDGRTEVVVNLDQESDVAATGSSIVATGSTNRTRTDVTIEDEDDDPNDPKPGPSGLNRVHQNSNLSQIRRNYYDDDSDDDSELDNDFNRARRRYAGFNVKHERLDSDDESVEIIGVVKPLAERTPELIELTDDEDDFPLIEPSLIEVMNKSPDPVPKDVDDSTLEMPLNVVDDDEEESVHCTSRHKRKSKKRKKHKKDKCCKRLHRSDHKCRKVRREKEPKIDLEDDLISEDNADDRLRIHEMMSDDDSIEIDVALNNSRPKSFIGRVVTNRLDSPTSSNMISRSHSPSIYLNLSPANNQDIVVATSSSGSSIPSTISSISSVSSASGSSSSSVSEVHDQPPSLNHSSRPSSSSESLSAGSSSTSSRSSSRSSYSNTGSALNHTHNTATLISDSLAVINNINRNVNIALNRLPSVIGSTNLHRKSHP